MPDCGLVSVCARNITQINFTLVQMTALQCTLQYPTAEEELFALRKERNEGEEGRRGMRECLSLAASRQAICVSEGVRGQRGPAQLSHSSPICYRASSELH